MMCDRTGIKNSDWHLLCQLLAMRSRTEPSVAINFFIPNHCAESFEEISATKPSLC